MRMLLAVVAAGVLSAPLFAQGIVSGQGGGEDVGALGPVNALGQEIRRAAPPTDPPPRLPDGTINLGDGLWIGGGPGDMASALPKGESLPLLPWGEALLDDRVKRPADDPYYWCLPMGVPRVTPYPWRFVQNYTHAKPTHLFILHEAIIHTYRQIFMDGRAHPPDLDPTWFGHSIGRWEGDTLVIDTVGYNDKFWFDRKGTPHTEQLHTVERWTRVTRGTLVNAITIDDPGAYSRPFVATFNARLAPAGDELMENFCQENNQFGTAGGHTHPFAR
ncbi:MAG: hypothetical protein HY824_15510 [Acidobacteria bacterium]|nr:hypothetical protein [Acidobacteriota bacterium]